MRLRSIVSKGCLGGLFSAGLCLFASAADGVPKPEFVFKTFFPKHGDVDYDTPEPKAYADCKVEVIRGPVVNFQKKQVQTTGWIVVGPQGQLLRRFMDNNGDGQVDEWSYYKNGLEVYRDADLNGNEKIDNSRWLNTGGTRWAIDANEDGVIDSYKMISPEEVSRVAVRALVTQNANLIKPLLITQADLKTLGIGEPYDAKILAAVADPDAKLKAIVAKSKLINPKATWVHFDSPAPSVIPAEQLKTPGDIMVYENAMAIVDSGATPAAPPGPVLIGELVRLGETWKITGMPLPIEGQMQIAEAGVLMQPQFAGPADVGNKPVPGAIPPAMQRWISALQELDKNTPTPAAPKALWIKHHAERADIIDEIRKVAPTKEEQEQWTRQLVDGIAAATQDNAFPKGLERLKALEDEAAKAGVKNLVAYIRYRRLLADFNLQMQAANNAQRANIQLAFMKELEAYITAFPNGDDVPDAMLQLAVAEEFDGKIPAATAWYEKLVKASPETPAGIRAAGALKRLNLDGKMLALVGPSLSGGQYDIAQLKGKKILVLFWATWCKPCTEDLPQLKAIYEEHKAKGFEVLGINLDDNKALVAPYLEQHKITMWPQIHEKGGLDSIPARSFGIISLPTMFLVDETGKVMNRATNVADLKTTLAGPVKEEVTKKDGEVKK